MSSKLIRNEQVATEPVAWRKVQAWDSVTGPGPENYFSEPGFKSAPSPQAEAEQRLAAAERAGFEQGHAAGRNSLAEELDSLRLKLARTVEELTGMRARYRRQGEQDMVALALAVARRILHRELTVAPEALLGLVKAALDKMEAREVHQVRVARSDAQMVRQYFEQMGPPQRVEVIADAILPAGSVLIESKRGTLDASVDTQLAEIERGFADIVRADQVRAS